jgi:hypothetical protein
MTTTLTDHLVGLAATLNDLRRRVRQAAREEVARAVGEALRQVALSMIGGSPRPLPRRSAYSAWDDPWQDPAEDPWTAGASFQEETFDAGRSVAEASPLHPAVVAGLLAVRWGYARTRQPLSAVAIGLGVSFAAFAGGPTMQALVAAWSAANDLLYYPDFARPS